MNEQEKQIASDALAERWIANAFSTKKMTSDEKILVAGSIKKMYKRVDLEQPAGVVFAPNLDRLFKYTDLLNTDKYIGFANDLDNKKRTVANVVDALEEDIAKGVEAPVSDRASRRHGGSCWTTFAARLELAEDILECKGVDYGPWHDARPLYENCCCSMMDENWVIVCDRPKLFSFDEDGIQAHRSDGPCIEWDDGWGVFGYHGLLVPDDVIMNPESITSERIQSEENMEQRRVMIERFGMKDRFEKRGRSAGYTEYFKASGAKLLDVDVTKANPNAPRFLYKDKRGDKFLLCSDGTDEEGYVLNVSPQYNTCRDAVKAINLVADEHVLLES